nr:immunoglobulin heavy chain junction region [Mus musculus]
CARIYYDYDESAMDYW